MRGDRAWRAHLALPALAAGVAVLLVAGALAPAVRGTVGLPGYLAMAGGSLALLATRRTPVAALTVATACMLAYTLSVPAQTSSAFPVLITVYAVAVTGRTVVAAGGSGVFLLGALLIQLADPGVRPPGEIVDRTGLLVGWFVAANIAGTVTRQRRAHLEHAEQRALDAERTREETALRRAGEERLRIARELHDSLTHTISIVKVQAGVAVHLSRKRGEDVPPALLAIEEASGEAMRELRATLELLRDPGEQPETRVDRLGELVERARSVGVRATLSTGGAVRPLPPEVDWAAYRIVQESLTNVARHAPGSQATVRVAYEPDALVVRVDDDGRRASVVSEFATGGSHRPGVGLTGMRERVSALGGQLLAGPRPEGGFAVRAELPLTASGRADVSAGEDARGAA
ncbi:sensor histidine kinase [Microbispora sp. RL4-1S]|uniref:histidine kinase n=1 Tax=Microbispora oryzae TaxID=2806554 RepID=A0A940WLG5_9ACTN|nr:sensor histidine kinase [Microbispora oryzae]MBP2705123.1 sensor histidine kinase [Microbispora oryzae]